MDVAVGWVKPIANTVRFPTAGVALLSILQMGQLSERRLAL